MLTSTGAPIKAYGGASYASLKVKFVAVFVFLVSSLVLAKTIAIVFTTPLMGYANNYDFLRESSCVGVWQAYPDKPKVAAHPEAPVNSLVYDGDRIRRLCMASVDVVFPGIAALFHGKGSKIDFREISIWKILLSVGGLFLLLHIVSGALNKIAIALTYFFVFGDLANLLYANTLYFEFSVIIGGFFALFATAFLITGSRKVPLFLLAAASILWLGFSKQQYMPLAVVLGFLGSAVVWIAGARKASVALVLISVTIPLVYAKMNNEKKGHMRGINFANKTDTFLWAVLPAASDKSAALEHLGLPEHCMQGVGKNWYMPNIQQNHPCPEVEHLSRARLLSLFVADPATFLEPMRQAIVALPPFYPDHLGHMENKTRETSPAYVLAKNTSLSHLFAKIPKDAFLSLVLASILAGLPLLLLSTLQQKFETHTRLFFAMVGLGALMVLYSISSSVFGDGYSDIPKHAVGFLIGISFQVAALILAGAYQLVGWWHAKTSKTSDSGVAFGAPL